MKRIITICAIIFLSASVFGKDKGKKFRVTNLILSTPQFITERKAGNMCKAKYVVLKNDGSIRNSSFNYSEAKGMIQGDDTLIAMTTAEFKIKSELILEE